MEDDFDWGAFASESKLDNDTAKFISISNCLFGIKQFDLKWASNADPTTRISESRLRTYRKPKKALPPEAKKMLHLAWSTETTAHLVYRIGKPEIMQISLPTLPVQSYYSVYTQARALSIVSGSPLDSHAKIQERYATQYSRGSIGALAVTLTGSLDDLKVDSPSMPIDAPDGFNPVYSTDDPGIYVTSSLKTARKWKLEKARKNWLKGLLSVWLSGWV